MLWTAACTVATTEEDICGSEGSSDSYAQKGAEDPAKGLAPCHRYRALCLGQAEACGAYCGVEVATQDAGLCLTPVGSESLGSRTANLNLSHCPEGLGAHGVLLSPAQVV